MKREMKIKKNPENSGLINLICILFFLLFLLLERTFSKWDATTRTFSRQETTPGCRICHFVQKVPQKRAWWGITGKDFSARK